MTSPIDKDAQAASASLREFMRKAIGVHRLSPKQVQRKLAEILAEAMTDGMREIAQMVAPAPRAKQPTINWTPELQRTLLGKCKTAVLNNEHYEDVARIMGLPPNAVRLAINRYVPKEFRPRSAKEGGVQSGSGVAQGHSTVERAPLPADKLEAAE